MPRGGRARSRSFLLDDAVALVAKGRYTDLLFMARRRRPTTLTAEMQWQLMPPLMTETPDIAVASVVEPA